MKILKFKSSTNRKNIALNNTLKWLLLLMIYCSVSSSAVAQISIKGHITDAADNSQLPFVHITFGNQQYGTTSNENGDFLISIPAKFQTDTLIFSYLGYASKGIKISDLATGNFLEVQLQPQTFELGLVEVTVIDALALVEKAIQQIPKNYADQAIMLTGFYREEIRQNLSNITNLYTEGVIDVYKESYLERRISKDKVVLRKGFQKKLPYEFFGKKETHYLPPITQGAFLPVILDFIKYNGSFIGKRKLSKYMFTYVSSTFIDKDLVHIIKFQPTKKGLFEGELFIHEKSNAFIKANYQFTPYGVLQFNFIDNSDLTLLSRNFEVNFSLFNQKWYLQNAHVTQQYSIANEPEPLDCEMTYTTTKININNIKRFRRKDQFDLNDAFVEHAEVIDTNYWEGYNILLKGN